MFFSLDAIYAANNHHTIFSNSDLQHPWP